MRLSETMQNSYHNSASRLYHLARRSGGRGVSVMDHSRDRLERAFRRLQRDYFHLQDCLARSYEYQYLSRRFSYTFRKLDRAYSELSRGGMYPDSQDL